MVYCGYYEKWFYCVSEVGDFVYFDFDECVIVKDGLVSLFCLVMIFEFDEVDCIVVVDVCMGFYWLL